MHRNLSVLLVSACLLFPLALQAQDRHDERRYYDRYHRDYHTWNNQEDRAYRVYLGERHRDYREFHRERRDRQREYFVWRHQHPDSALFKIEIR